MKNSLIEILNETLKIINCGFYDTSGHQAVLHDLQINKQDFSKAIYYSESEVDKCVQSVKELNNYRVHLLDKCNYSVVNADSFSAAKSLIEKYPSKKIMVLNFANPFNPGGGVRIGAVAQEEDLCRKSTLLASLESDDAKIYYDVHNKSKNYFSSNAILVSENVEVFRDQNNKLLEKSFIVSVLTCAAPYIRYSEDYCKTHREEYEKLIYDRIFGILSVAQKYTDILVLGAWGCGAFCNDARLIANTFKKCLSEINILSFDMDGATAFQDVVFAVLDKFGNGYNITEFKKVFG